MKLDQKFYGNIRKAKDDTRVTDDEWVVFLTKDTAFALALPHYRQACIDLGCDAEQIAGVDRLIANVTAWREANPDKLKKPDFKGERMLANEGGWIAP